MRFKTSITKRLFKSVIATLLTASVISSSFGGALGASNAKAAPAEPKRKTSLYNKGYNEKKWLQPTGATFTMDSLMTWNPENDPDAELNRATVPLNKTRFRGHVVNPKASNEASIMNCSISNWSHDLAPSVGADDFNFYAFDYWQYIGLYIYWSGSANGIITVPTPDLIDAAHREGVAVHGMLGFPWGSNDEGLAQLRKLIHKESDGSYPVMDKLMQVAVYFGFDGWFFNQETYGANSGDAVQLRDAMIWAKKKYPGLTFSWYDSMSPQGQVYYQNALNDTNKWWMEKVDGVAAVDYFFLNYNWNQAKVQNTVDAANSIGRSPYDVYGGLEVQQNSYNTYRMPVAYLPEPKTDGIPRISIALFAANSTMGLAKNPEDFHNHENIFYTGWEGDPTISGTKKGKNPLFKGMSRFVSDSSTITSLPFYTDFNSSHGRKFFRDGEEVRDHGWSSRFSMKTNPTWRWWIRSNTATTLSARYDFDTAYNGGNSFRFSAKSLLDNTSNKVMLYSTKLNVEAATKALVTYKGKPGVNVSLVLNTNSNYDASGEHAFPLPEASDAWHQETVDISSLNGQTVYAIALKFDNASQVQNYSFNLGELGMFNERVKPGSASNVTQLETMLKSAYEAEARLYWDKGTNVSYYEVYQDRGDGKLNLVNTTTNNYFYSAFFRRLPSAQGTTTKISVVPVSFDGTRGDAASFDFDWGMTVADTDELPPPAVNVCLHTKITGKSGENSGEPAIKAFDGTATGNSKWCLSGRDSGWISIDLGSPKTIRRVRLEHGEYGGEAANTNTNRFHLEYKDGGAWVSLGEPVDIGAPKAVTDVNLKTPVTAQEWKLVIEDAGSSPWGAIRLYEWQMFETILSTPVIPIENVVATNNAGAEDEVVFKGVPAKTVVNIYKHIHDEEPIASLKNDSASDSKDLTFSKLNLGTDEGLIYYNTVLDDTKPSVRLAAPYPSEQNSVKRLNVSFTKSSEEGKMDIRVNNLVPGEYIYLVDKHGYKLGPVAEGESSLTYKNYPISVGESLNLQAKQPKLNRSDIYSVEATEEPYVPVKGAVSITVSTEDGLALTGAEVKITRDGEPVDTIMSVSDSPVVISLDAGNYQLENLSVGMGAKGYTPDPEKKNIEITSEDPVPVHFTAKKIQAYFDLKSLYEENADKDLAPYTEKTAEAFRTAYDEAGKLLAKDTQSSDAYTGALTKLREAIEGLEKKPVEASVSITVSTEDGLALTGAEVKIMKDNEPVDTVRIVSASPVVVTLQGGTYELQNTTLGEGWKGYLPDSEKKSVNIASADPVEVRFTAKKVQGYFDLKDLHEKNADKDLAPYTKETADVFVAAYEEATKTLAMDTQNEEVYAEVLKKLEDAISHLEKKLLPVTNLKAESEEDSVILSWTASEGADGYEIYWKGPGQNKMAYFLEMRQTKLVTNVAKAGTYFFRVYPYQMKNGNKVMGESTEYVYVKVGPNAPAKVNGLKLTEEAGELTLTWNEVPEADGYIVYRMAPGDEKMTEYMTTEETEFVETAENYGRYIYLVQAYSEAGSITVRGFGSEAIGVTVRPEAADPARNLKLTQKANGRVIELTWDKADKADGYLVYRRGPGDKEMKYVYAKTTTIYQDVVKEKGIYFYAVISYRKVNGEMIISPQDGYKYTTIR